MKIRLFPSLGLIAILLAACASATPVAVQPPQTPLPTLETSLQPTFEATKSLEPTLQAVATSRGPNLEATDPSTVNLASGQLQLVEFFRFT